MHPDLNTGRRRLPLVLIGNGLMRIAGGAGAVLIGLYLSDLAGRSEIAGATLVGTLGAVSFAAELTGALPMGVLSDRFRPRALMVGGALLGAVATQLFGISGAVSIFFLSRALEGLAAAAGAPPILAHLTDVTEGDSSLRGKAMSYFELSLLAGLGLGAVAAGYLWEALHAGAFAAVAAIYLLAAVLLAAGAVGSRGHSAAHALAGVFRALREPSLQRLAPAWLCMNTIGGLWLGSTFPYLMTLSERRGQYLTGLFANRPAKYGYVQLGYVIVFATGVTLWSFVMARLERLRVLRIALLGMLAACAGFYVLNHSQEWADAPRRMLLVIIALCVMVESGFTPAALALLADVVGSQSGRGAAMGIYSVLLSVGALIGSAMAGALGERFAVDGLIHGTLGMAVIALIAVQRLSRGESHTRTSEAAAFTTDH